MNNPTSITQPAFNTADIADQLGPLARCVPMQWLRLGGRPSFHGTLSTLRCRDAVGLLRQCIDEPGSGRVLLVDGGGSRATALLGDRMAQRAADKGWAGLLIHGAVRDADSLASIEIGVFALARTPARASGELSGERDVPVVLDGVTLHPGSHLFCDGDGLVVCSAQDAQAILVPGDR